MRSKNTTRFIPSNMIAYVGVIPEGCAVYVGERSAIGFNTAKKVRPSFYYTFRNNEARDKYIASWIQSEAKTAEYRAAKKTVAKDPVTLKVGDIVHTCWGYDQTNSDFYQVVAMVGNCSVSVRPIRASVEETGFMCGTATAIPNEFCGPATTRRVRYGNTVINVDGSHSGSLGSTTRVSWYA